MSFKLHIDKIANGGYALGRHEGRIVFVPYVVPGETIRAEYTNQQRNFAHAEAVDILDESPHRVEPPCPHFGPGLCGGCQWQHIDYAQQVDYKRQMVTDHFKRIGKFRHVTVLDTLSGPMAWHYLLSVRVDVTEDGAFAYPTDDGEGLLPIETCYIIHPTILDILAELELPAETTITEMEIFVGSNPEEMMVVIRTEDDLAPEIEVDLPISINLLLSDNEPVNLIGKSHVTYRLFDRAFRVTAGSFFRTNTPLTEILVDEVITRLNLKGEETVLELYSGVGTLSAFIAERCGHLVTVESYPPAVTDADGNLSDLENVDLVEGPVEAVLEDLEGPFDAAVLDPAGFGLSEEAVEGIERLKLPMIVYVGADLSTMARDARQLVKLGYQLKDIRPLDTHPQTAHFEAVATFRLR